MTATGTAPRAPRLAAAVRAATAATAMAAIVAVALTTPARPAVAQTAPRIAIAINQSPWLDAFVALVDRYEEETGNEIALDVLPFGGLLEKIRNSVRSSEGQYDIVTINAVWLAELFAGGFLTPLSELDSTFALPQGVLDYDGTAYWNATTGAFGGDGTLMGVPLNGNVQVLYYRRDLYEAAGLSVPQTWDDLIANAEALNDPPRRYGFVPRAARSSIVYNFTPYLFSHGGSFFADPLAGDFSVTLNSPHGLAALETYLALAGEVAPPNAGAIGQGELIQLLATGKGAQAVAVIAAWGGLEDRDRSAVAGKLDAALLPAGPDGERASAAGHWIASIPRNVPADRRSAAFAFLTWFLERETQIEYVKAGGVPVRDDLADSDLAADPAFRFIDAFSRNAKVAVMGMPLKEGAQISDAIALHLNRAVLGEITAREALNAAAQEMHKILTQSGYDVRPPGTL